MSPPHSMSLFHFLLLSRLMSNAMALILWRPLSPKRQKLSRRMRENRRRPGPRRNQFCRRCPYPLELDSRFGRQDERAERNLERVSQQVRFVGDRRCGETSRTPLTTAAIAPNFRKSVLQVHICMASFFPALSTHIGPNPIIRRSDPDATLYLPIRLLWCSKYTQSSDEAASPDVPITFSCTVQC